MLRSGTGNIWGRSTCAALLWIGAAVGVARADAIACIGDCDGDGTVTVGEVVKGVNMALGSLPTTACAAFDISSSGPPVAISQLVTAVNDLLDGCPVTPTTPGFVFNGQENRMDVYVAGPGFPKQTFPSNGDAPGVGRDLNGQICFTYDAQTGAVHFIAGEDSNQGSSHETAGWGYFELTGSQVGDFHYNEVGKLTPTYQPTADGAENYGCGFLSDGRLLTTDVGNQSGGNGNGQLVIWFPPFDVGANYTPDGVVPTTPAHYCKLDITIATAQQIAIDSQDRIYVGSSRDNLMGSGAGVYRYTGPFPTSDTPDGGCDGVDNTGAPMATHITKERFIPSDANIPTPAGVVIKPDGGFYVSSVLNGVIAEYDGDGHFLRKVLIPSNVGIPITSGTPLGIGLASDGTLFYADIGLRIGAHGIGPGNDTGSVRRLRFVNGAPQPPETMDTGLDFPDGIGILNLPGQ